MSRKRNQTEITIERKKNENNFNKIAANKGNNNTAMGPTSLLILRIMIFYFILFFDFVCFRHVRYYIFVLQLSSYLAELNEFR